MFSRNRNRADHASVKIGMDAARHASPIIDPGSCHLVGQSDLQLIERCCHQHIDVMWVAEVCRLGDTRACRAQLCDQTS